MKNFEPDRKDQRCRLRDPTEVEAGIRVLVDNSVKMTRKNSSFPQGSPDHYRWTSPRGCVLSRCSRSRRNRSRSPRLHFRPEREVPVCPTSPLSGHSPGLLTGHCHVPTPHTFRGAHVLSLDLHGNGGPVNLVDCRTRIITDIHMCTYTEAHE